MSEKPSYHSSDLRKGRITQPFGLYFIRKSVLAGHELSEDQRDEICEALQHFRRTGQMYLHAFVVMPDHWHILLSLGKEKALSVTMRELCRRSSYPEKATQ